MIDFSIKNYGDLKDIVVELGDTEVSLGLLNNVERREMAETLLSTVSALCSRDFKDEGDFYQWVVESV